MTPEEFHLSKLRILYRATDPDRFVCRILYRDAKGCVTSRYISPIAVRGSIVRALCLCREEVRQFRIGNIRAIKLVEASKVLMPTQIIEVPESPSSTPLKPDSSASKGHSNGIF